LQLSTANVAVFKTKTPDLGRSRRCDQFTAKGVVGIDDRVLQPFPNKQLLLGGGIVFHRAVVIEMILRQVGEHGRLEGHAMRARLRQSMRGHFHGDMACTLIAQLRQPALQGHRVERGMGRALQRARKTIAHRPQHRALVTQSGKSLRQPVGDRGLAVGAGYADRPHGAGRIAEQMAGDHAGLRAQLRHSQIRRSPGRIPQEMLGLPQYRARPVADCVGNVVATVGVFALKSQENVARFDLAAINLNTAIVRQRINGNPVRGWQIPTCRLHVSSFTSGVSPGRTMLLVGASGGTPS